MVSTLLNISATMHLMKEPGCKAVFICKENFLANARIIQPIRSMLPMRTASIANKIILQPTLFQKANKKYCTLSKRLSYEKRSTLPEPLSWKEVLAMKNAIIIYKKYQPAIRSPKPAGSSLASLPAMQCELQTESLHQNNKQGQHSFIEKITAVAFIKSDGMNFYGPTQKNVVESSKKINYQCFNSKKPFEFYNSNGSFIIYRKSLLISY